MVNNEGPGEGVQLAKNVSSCHTPSHAQGTVTPALHPYFGQPQVVPVAEGERIVDISPPDLGSVKFGLGGAVVVGKRVPEQNFAVGSEQGMANDIVLGRHAMLRHDLAMAACHRYLGTWEPALPCQCPWWARV